MPHKTVSSRDFNQDSSGVKRAAAAGPVVITDRGRPAHVLMTIEDYWRLTNSQTSIVDLLGQTEAKSIDFEPQRLPDRLFRPADFG